MSLLSAGTLVENLGFADRERHHSSPNPRMIFIEEKKNTLLSIIHRVMFCRKQDRGLFCIISSSQSWDIPTHCVVPTPSTLQPLCPKSGVLREKADSSERTDGEASGNFRILSLYHTDPICPILSFRQLIVPCSWACPICATEAMLRYVAHLGPAAVRTGSRGCVSICVALSVVLRGKCQSVFQLLYLQYSMGSYRRKPNLAATP